jgi:DNA repair exonuclease SbcCD ATPase subunit
MDALARHVQDDMRRVATAIRRLRGALDESAGDAPATAASLVGERLAALLGRRLEEVEGAVAVATALAERTGVELRAELHAATEALADELESVADAILAGVDAKTRAVDDRVELRIDEVHRRIDAITRELRAELDEVGSLPTGLPAPYADRLAETLGRRLARLEGTVEVTHALVARTGAEVRDELADVAAAGELRRRALADELAAVQRRLESVEGRTDEDAASLATLRVELRSFEVSLCDELQALRGQLEARTADAPGLELALTELRARLQVVEDDRNSLTAQVVYASETWAAERVALNERVAELAARIVTGPLPSRDGAGADGWPTARAFDQLRIAVEGLRMRLAYHEKTVAELVRGRDVDERIEDVERLLRRIEGAGSPMREEADSALDRLERVAEHMDARLAALGGPPGDA